MVLGRLLDTVETTSSEVSNPLVACSCKGPVYSQLVIFKSNMNLSI